MMPEEYIALKCGHDFCLICLAYSYLQTINENVKLYK